MGGLAAAAENRGPVKKRKKNSSVKLKASDYVGLPNKSHLCMQALGANPGTSTHSEF